MNSLLDKALVKPLFRAWVFVRKHPFLTVTLGAFLFLLPPLGVLIYALGAKAAGYVGKALGADTGRRFSDFVESVLVKVSEPPWAWTVPALAALFFPPLGVLFFFWTLVDFFKGERIKTTATGDVATPAPAAQDAETDAPRFDIDAADDDEFSTIA